ncbi:MAG: hypothetical protein ACLRXC_01680 [[Clostridium] leptum]
MNARGYGLPGKPGPENPVCLAGWSAFGGLFGRIGVFSSSFGMGKLDFYYFPALAGAEWTTAVAAFFWLLVFTFDSYFYFHRGGNPWLFLKSKISRLPIPKHRSRR